MAIAMIEIIKSKVELVINILIIEQINIAINPINRYGPTLVKSVLVVAPIRAKTANMIAASKKTYIIEPNSYVTNIVENVRPLTAE